MLVQASCPRIVFSPGNLELFLTHFASPAVSFHAKSRTVNFPKFLSFYQSSGDGGYSLLRMVDFISRFIFDLCPASLFRSSETCEQLNCRAWLFFFSSWSGGSLGVLVFGMGSHHLLLSFLFLCDFFVLFFPEQCWIFFFLKAPCANFFFLVSLRSGILNCKMHPSCDVEPLPLPSLVRRLYNGFLFSFFLFGGCMDFSRFLISFLAFHPHRDASAFFFSDQCNIFITLGYIPLTVLISPWIMLNAFFFGTLLFVPGEEFSPISCFLPSVLRKSASFFSFFLPGPSLPSFSSQKGFPSYFAATRFLRFARTCPVVFQLRFSF